MPLTSLFPPLSAFFLVFFMILMLKQVSLPKNLRWLLPVSLSLAFLLFSLTAVITEGGLGFWSEHTRNLWGNQIWFDLLLAVSIGWFLIVPQARQVGMRLIPWLVLIICTGSIGFLAMLARLLYLQGQAERPL